jgi:hypothetical protein
MKKILPLFISLFLLLGCDKMSMSEAATYGPTNGQGGSMARFTIAGNYLYTVDKTDLKVFDIANPAEPVFKQTVPVGFEIETIFPFGDKLFIGSTSVVHIFSIADPARPQKLSEAISPTVLRRCDPVVAKDKVAYATLRVNGPCGGTGSILAVYDITNITAPVQRHSVPVTEPYGLGYANNTLFVCDKVQGLLVFDITKPYEPRLLKSLKDGDYIDVIPFGNLLVCWISNGMLIYDITDNNNPQLLTRIV